MLGIADIELVPARNIATAPAPEQKLDAHAKTFKQAGDANHVLHNHPVTSVLLGAKLFEATDMLIVAGEHVTAEQPIEAQLTLARIGRRVRSRFHDDRGMELIHRRRRCSIVAAAVSPNARSTFTRSVMSRTSRNAT